MDNSTIKRILSLNCKILNIDAFNTMIIDDPALNHSDPALKKNTFAYRNNLYKIPDDNAKYPQLHKFRGKMHIIIPFKNSLEDIYLRQINKTKSDQQNNNFKIDAELQVDSQIKLTNILNHYKFCADCSAKTQLTAIPTNKPIEIKVNDIDINEFLQKEKTKLYKQFIRLKKYSYIDHKNKMIKYKLNNLEIKIDNLYNYIDSEGYNPDDMFKDF